MGECALLSDLKSEWMSHSVSVKMVGLGIHHSAGLLGAKMLNTSK